MDFPCRPNILFHVMTLFFLALACTHEPHHGAWARRIESLDQAIGGPKAAARPGDILLENDRVRFAILDARASMGPGLYGGSVVDADLVRANPAFGAGRGNDQLAEVFPTVNMNLAAADAPAEVSIVADGADGGDAIVRVDAAGAPFFSLLTALWSLVDQPDMRITTDYILSPGAPGLRMRTTVSFQDPAAAPEPPEGRLLSGAGPGEPDMALLETAISTGAALGDFYLQGGSVDVFAPGIGFDEDGAVFRANEAGRNTFQDPFRFGFIAGVGDGVSYGLVATHGDLFVPLFTSSQTAAFGAAVERTQERGRFAPTDAFAYDRWLLVGHGDVGSLMDAMLEVRGAPRGRVRGHVLEEGTGIALSDVSVLVYEPGAAYPTSQWQTDVGADNQPDGSFAGSLPPGDWELLVHAVGRPEGARVPIRVAEGSEQAVVLASPRPGQVSVEVVDELGRRVPAKVTFLGDARHDPSRGDDYLPGGPSEVVFAPEGVTEVVLPPGTYTAVASRGLEYELAESAPFTVTRDGVQRLRLQVVRSIDTSGWVSADFHVHAVHSFDSGTRLSDRVATMVCEGVEFFASSDHDYLTDYAPVVEDLGLEPWVRTAVGLETTTLELGHFIGFPLADDTVADQGGSFDWTGMQPGEVLATLQELGTKAGYTPLRFVAHPRDGILGYFDQYGFDPSTGQIETPTLALFNPLLQASAYSDDYEALELLNGKRVDLPRSPTQAELDAVAQGGGVTAYDVLARTGAEQEALASGVMRLGYGQDGQVDDWFTLLNLGHRITALGNSDTHGRYVVEAGCPRNYVMADTDDPAALEPQAIADAVRAGKVVASYGPFIRAWANDPEHGIGSDLVDTDGIVDLHVEVQAPTWIAVDRVELYQNGTLIHEWEGLEPDTLRLVADLAVPVARDSWFVVVALGDGDLAPVFTPVEMPPVELQDVVTEALQDVAGIGRFLSPAVPVIRTGPVVPYALTNPIRVDTDGAGWTAPGIPEWVQPPLEPAR
jgi:hypothetical protein